MNSSLNTLDYTGERMVPENTPDLTFWEHIYRYRFATRFVEGKRVLDIACGEGYGTAALLQAGASSIIGVDISPEVCDHAHRKYDVKTLVGDATSIPLADDSVDIVISFETIEHLEEPQRFVDECARVLAPGGVAVISTPNTEIFQASIVDNPFHVSEMSKEDFVKLLKTRFEHCTLYSQRPVKTAWWSPRNLAMDIWALEKIRGGRRIRQRMRAMYCSQLSKRNTEKARQNPVKTIMSPEKALSPLFNIYDVRPYNPLYGEDPTFIIAVVSSPITP